MFQPKLCIGIGERSHYYTLRMSHPVYVPGEGPYGNAVVNGVYQGRVEIGWHHVQNLSQNADEAVEKANELAVKMGVPLVSVSAAALGEQLAEIKRADAEELERREKARIANEERYAAMQEARAELELMNAQAGYIPFGRNAGMRIANCEFGYIQWLIAKRDELQGAMRAVADYAHDKLPHLHAWQAGDEHVGWVGKRMKGVRLQVQKCIPIDSQYGLSWLMICVDEDGHRVKQFCSGAKWAEEGDECVVDMTVKGHGEYNGQKQTMVNRVKCHERHELEANDPGVPEMTLEELRGYIVRFGILAQRDIATDLVPRECYWLHHEDRRMKHLR